MLKKKSQKMRFFHKFLVILRISCWEKELARHRNLRFHIVQLRKIAHFPLRTERTRQKLLFGVQREKLENARPAYVLGWQGCKKAVLGRILWILAKKRTYLHYFGEFCLTKE
jgi:hypothetical protein